jgi:hypothetical protein
MRLEAIYGTATPLISRQWHLGHSKVYTSRPGLSIWIPIKTNSSSQFGQTMSGGAGGIVAIEALSIAKTVRFPHPNSEA